MSRDRKRNAVSLGVALCMCVGFAGYSIGKGQASGYDGPKESKTSSLEVMRKTKIIYKGEKKTVRGAKGQILSPILYEGEMYLPLAGVGRNADGTNVKTGEGRVELFEKAAARESLGDFETETLDGEGYGLDDIRKNEQTVLISITSWCPYCKDIMDTVETYSGELGKSGIGVAFVMLDNDSEKMKDIQDAFGLKTPILLNHEEIERNIHSSVESVPMATVLDREGNIVRNNVDVKDSEALMLFAESLIGKEGARNEK